MNIPFIQYPYINETDLNLDYVLKKVRELIDAVNSLNAWKGEEAIKIDQIYKWYDDLMAGNLTPGLVNAINEWCRENIINIIGELVHMVFFGINDEGYFVAYIPEGWDDIIFSTTGLDITIPGLDYGRLVLSY